MANSDNWSLVIKPKSKLGFAETLSSVWNYRDLLVLFVRRDFVALYKQTILGPLWFFIQPILSTIIFTVVFGNIAKIPTDGVPQPLFYLAGITLWNYFSECLTKTSETFTANANIFGKVYFPRIIIPLSIIVSNLLKLGVQLLLFLAVFFYYWYKNDQIQPNIYLLALPLLIIIMGGLGLGLGLIFSSLTTKYRDLKFLIQFGVQLMMYASPIVYPLSLVSGKFKTLLLVNPITGIIEAFRYGFLSAGEFNWMYLGYSFACMAVILTVGVIIFNSIERSFMDTV